MAEEPHFDLFIEAVTVGFGTEQRRATHVLVSGEIDLATGDGFRKGLARAIAGSQPTVIVDMSRVDFMDATGVNVLVTARRQAVLQGVDLQLAAPSQAVQRVLALTGADIWLTIFPSDGKD